MSDRQQFGGNWTIEKLEILTGYLDAYLIALKKMIETEFPDLRHLTTVYCGDANAQLTKIIQNIDWRFSRALLFLDPCATEVNWATLQTVSSTKAIDVWYLFPFSALNRMLCRNGKIDKSWEDCIDRLLGDSEWRTEFYKEDDQLNLFDEPGIIKDASVAHMQRYILKRLSTIFPKVASNPRILKNEKNSPLFLFCFAIANTSPKAQALALKIAEYILGKRR